MNKYHQSFMVAISFCLSVCQVMAQKTLLIKPTIAVVFPLSSIDPPSSSLEESHFLHVSPQVGGDLQLDPGTRWRFSVGGHYSAYGISYKESRFATADRGIMIRVPLQSHYTFADNIRVLNLDRTRYAYLLLFRLYAIAALDFNYAATLASSFKHKGNINTAHSVITVQEEAGRGRSNFAPGIGFGIQFFDRAGHDRLDISFYYSRGMSLLAYQDIIYKTQTGSEQIRLSSKGSLFGVNLSYPIRLPL